VTLRHFRPEFHGMTRFFTRKPEAGTSPIAATVRSEAVNA
jgi:hypothetical protein